MFQPHTDTTYILCVSMLDFWLPGGAVELVVYAHSIDFGAKGYGNLVELASLQRHVADALGLPAGRLLRCTSPPARPPSSRITGYVRSITYNR
jgi:thymidylate synthase